MNRQNGYAYRQGEGLSIVLRGTTMYVEVTQEQSQGTFSVIEMAHPPNLSIPLHVHPRGHEAFYVLDGSYRIRCGDEQYDSQRGDFVFVPKGLTHNYEVGPEGGRLLVVSPPGLEKFFHQLSEALKAGPVTLEQEDEIARRYGQEILNKLKHWGQ